jgi:dTDP-4-amino-4,6-dideoxy-D-galactose acyltransferase
MIRELAWDSIFFKRKIGELKLSRRSLNQINASLKNAKEEGFKYILCKIKSQETDITKFLESLGFYLTDIGIICALETEKFKHNTKKNSNMRKSIKIPTDKDIPMLKEISKSLFLESRFYNDPFFLRKETDNLYQTWIENSVRGQNADLVLCIPNIGFVTCKKSDKDLGEVILIGLKKEYKGKGIGTDLMEEAIRWFKTQNVKLVSVRTQLRNLNAINFYLKLGFYIKEYDIIFGKIL